MRPKVTELLYVEDFPAFVALGRDMVAETAPDEPYDEEEVTANLFMVVNDISRGSVNVWIAKVGDDMVGMAVAQIGKPLYSKAPIATLTLWYVKEAYRTTLAAFELLHNYEHWAKLQGAYRIEVGALRLDPKKSVEEADKINKIFSRRGYARAGEVFAKIV